MLPLALAPVFLVALASRQSVAVAHRISRTEDLITDQEEGNQKTRQLALDDPLRGRPIAEFLSWKPSIYGEPTPAPITIHKRQFLLPDFERPPMPDPTTLPEHGPPRMALP